MALMRAASLRDQSVRGVVSSSTGNGNDLSVDDKCRKRSGKDKAGTKLPRTPTPT